MDKLKESKVKIVAIKTGQQLPIVAITSKLPSTADASFSMMMSQIVLNSFVSVSLIIGMVIFPL